MTLAGAATNGPILSWKWTMLSVPSGSSADSGTNLNFTGGVSIEQNPQFDMDVMGCYVLQLEAENASGWSRPVADKKDGQTLCFMRTQALDRNIPGYQAYRYDPYLNETLLSFEGTIADHSARHENGGVDELSVAGLSGTLADPQTPTAHATAHEPGGGDAMAVDAAVATGSLRTLGTGAQQACAGDDARLSDARTPTSHAVSHQHGGADEVATATPAANAVPKAGAGGTLAGGWVTYGSASATACEGDDSRLSDARTPTAHATSHEPGGADAMAADALAATASLRTLGTGAQQACAGDDSRLSDARTPTSHATSHEPGGADALAVDAAVATGSLRTLGTGAQQACAGDDSRLSDARTPTSHAASHQHGGADEVATTTPAANAVPKAGAGGTLAGGWVPYGSSAATACEGNDARLSDARAPTAHAASHQSGGADAIKLDDLAAPDDNTDLNVSTSAHGLCPKLSGIASDGLKGDGSFGPVSPLSTKGDVYGYTTVPARIPVGTDGYVFTAEAAAAAGVAWRQLPTAHEQVIDSSVSGAFDTQIDYLVYGGALDTPSTYDMLVFRDGVKMTYAATPSAANEYGFNPTLNELRVIGDGSAHRWEVYYKSTANSAYTGSSPGTFGSATLGTATFDG